MAAVTILRRLWRWRWLTAVFAVAGIVVGVAMTYRATLPFKLQSRQYHVGIASARALVDTPSSQVVDLGGKTGADIRTLSQRATLLASLMTSAPIRDEIARQANIPLDMLVTPAMTGGLVAAAPRDVSGTVVTRSDRRAYVLRSTVPTLDSGQVPIIAVDTTAPDPATAAKLADVAIAVLRRHVKNVAGTEAVPIKRRVTVRELGAAHSTTEARGPLAKLAIFAGLFVFLASCLALLGADRLISSWRAASEAERRAAEPLHQGAEPFDTAERFADAAAGELVPVPSPINHRAGGA